MMGAVVSLGPGKAALLEAINRAGSISAAAREMGMSYRRAWNLIEAMNGDFRLPLVKKISGININGTKQTIHKKIPIKLEQNNVTT